MAVLKRVCDDRHRPIREINPDVPDWLEATIDRLLAKEPADRFQTANEVADLLETGLAHLQQPTCVPPPEVTGCEARGKQDLDVDLDLDLGRSAARTRPRANRRLVAVAAALVLLTMAGLGVTEAAGLTQVSEFVATVLRVKTPEGTLVIKVDDPAVKVRIDGDVVVIGGAGPQEIRLCAGSHHVQAIKGKLVREQLITITRGGKQIVNVGFELAESAVAVRGDSQPAVITPGSHVNQCMACHGNASVLKADAPLPSNHPPIDAAPTSANIRKDPASAWRPNAARARAMVWSLAYSQDGRSLAIAQQAIDRPPSILRIWDLAQHRDTIWFPHPVGYRSVAFSSDGRTLAAGNFDGNLSTLVADTWRIQTSENQGSPINTLAFLPGSTTFAAGDWDGWVRFHGPDSLASPRPLKYPGKIWSLAVSPDGSTMAVGGDGNAVQVYDVATRQHIITLKGHDHAVQSLDFSPDGKLLASAGGTNVRVWDTATWADRDQIQHHPEVVCVRFSPDGKLLAIADGESDLPHYKLLPTAIILWDVAARDEVRWLRGHTNTIWALAFSPDGKTLASGSADQTVKFWDTASGELRETIVPGESGYPHADERGRNK